MQIMQELEDYIQAFNTSFSEDFNIDSIRIEFSKQHKLQELKTLGNWSKVEKNSSLLSKLKKRLQKKEITSAWRLEKENIYYYNMQDAPKYRRATLVIFGMKQYHKPPPSKELVSKILQIMKDVSSLDVCIDLPYKPNFEALERYYKLTPYRNSNGVMFDTRYINDTSVPMLDKIIFYNKAFKNGLQGTLWRIEATISIANFKALMLPLYEFKEVIDLAKSNNRFRSIGL